MYPCLRKKGNQKITTAKQTVTEDVSKSHGEQNDNRNQVGLTVRIEINLPAEGDQETYDRIFKSIRENLLNG